MDDDPPPPPPDVLPPGVGAGVQEPGGGGSLLEVVPLIGLKVRASQLRTGVVAGARRRRRRTPGSGQAASSPNVSQTESAGGQPSLSSC